MGIILTSGDLFATPGIHAFAHGCNCAGAMGKGIAIEFKKRWPTMFREYRQRCMQGAFELGDVFVWREEGATIFNLGTQKDWRSKADLGAIYDSVRRMIEIAEENSIKTIGMPRIGAGLGGLSWELVKAELEKAVEGRAVELLVCEEYKARVPMNYRE